MCVCVDVRVNVNVYIEGGDRMGVRMHVRVIELCVYGHVCAQARVGVRMCVGGYVGVYICVYACVRMCVGVVFVCVCV